MLRPGSVCIAPGDFHLRVVAEGRDLVARLNQEPPENYCRPAVDVLFRSAADVVGSAVLSVVLTGMGSDGSRGARTIVERGGSVIAQDQASSVVWGMPGAVTTAGLAERGPVPERDPRRDHPAPRAPSRRPVSHECSSRRCTVTISPQAFTFVRELVRAESAIVLETGKEYLVESRLVPLARAAGHLDVDAYVADLSKRRTPGSLKQVVEALTTNETSWFRDSDPFTALRQTVFPALAKTRSDRTLRIWAGACSSGQEPYSIMMTALDTPELAGWKIDLVATDLSEEMLDRSRQGEYSQLEVNRGLPATTLVRHFERAGLSWRINQSIRDRVEFRQLNLTRPFPPMGRFDVVFLRNVLIYFDLPTKRDVLKRVRQVMAPDAHLFLGAAEMTMGVDDAWERVPAGRSSVYRIREEQRTCVH